VGDQLNRGRVGGREPHRVVRIDMVLKPPERSVRIHELVDVWDPRQHHPTHHSAVKFGEYLEEALQEVHG